MANPPAPGTLPDDFAAQVGHSLKGWAHLQKSLTRDVPVTLHKANIIRRNAVLKLKAASRQRA